jgi:small membrane protein
VTSIQGILIAGFVIAAIFASTVFRTKLVYRLITLLLFVTATFLVLFPDTTTVIAHALGVGRGADLLLYVSLITGIDVALLLYLRIRELERKLADLVRAVAVRDARQIAGKGDATGA